MSEAATATTTAAPAAPTTTAPATTTAAAPQAVASDWTKDLSPDMQGFVKNKGFTGPGMVLDSYVNLEKLRGVPEERLVRLPEKPDDAAGWEQVFSKMGRPATAKEYKLPTPEKGSDPAFTEWAKGTFFEAGLTQAQADKVTAKFNEYAQGTVGASKEQYVAKIEGEKASLKKEWGLAFEQNIGIAKKAANQFGVDGPTIDKLESAMGFAGLMKFFNKIGSGMGEDSFVTGASKVGAGALTPEAAKNRMTHLKGNPEYVKRYLNKQEPEYSEMARLHSFAYPDAE